MSSHTLVSRSRIPGADRSFAMAKTYNSGDENVGKMLDLEILRRIG
jgi:hypothetical protein